MLFSEDVKAAWGLATAVHSPGNGTLWRSLQRRHVVTTSVDIVKVRLAPGSWAFAWPTQNCVLARMLGVTPWRLCVRMRAAPMSMLWSQL
jgi:hypothetical protein